MSMCTDPSSPPPSSNRTGAGSLAKRWKGIRRCVDDEAAALEEQQDAAGTAGDKLRSPEYAEASCDADEEQAISAAIAAAAIEDDDEEEDDEEEAAEAAPTCASSCRDASALPCECSSAIRRFSSCSRASAAATAANNASSLSNDT
jgi:hypothetical protein